jgi:hypothetical protein
MFMFPLKGWMSDGFLPSSITKSTAIACVDFNVGAGGIEMRIAWNKLPGTANNGKKYFFGGTALVGWDNMLKRHQVSHSRFKPFKRRTSGVRFIALHNRTPLTGAHAAGARVGEQIDNNIFRIEFKNVVISRFDKGFALGAGGHFDGFYRFNAERFDDCFHCKNFDTKLKNSVGLKHD